MPIYEYRCGKCRKVFEALQKFSDPPLKKHEKCGGPLERLVSQSSFQLKGGGWYASGYAKEAPKGGSSSDAKAESTPNGASESKTETKTEATTESKSESKAETKPSKGDSKPAKTKSKH